MCRGDLSRATAESCGEWLDIAGQYLPQALVENILAEAEKSTTTLADIKAMFDKAMNEYEDMAAAYACNLLGNLLGRTPTSEDIASAIEAARNIHTRMRETTEVDRLRDIGTDMMIGYGYDFREIDEQEADFRNTR